VGTTLVLRIRKGSHYCHDAHLLINKPEVGAEGRLFYTYTQPFSHDGKLKTTEQQGWALRMDYFVRIAPKDCKDLTYFEFEVTFTESGSFFIQIQA